MSSERLTLVRRLVDAFNRNDIDSAADALDPAVELREWPTAPGAQTFHGVDGARAALAKWFDVWEWMRIEILDLVESGDRVLVTLHQRAKGRGSAIEVEATSFNVYTIPEGKVTRMELFTERDPALEAAGLTANNEEEKR